MYGNARILFPLSLIYAAVLDIAPVVAQEEVLFLEEVLVTAQRRVQNLREVPISVTAFSGDAMTRANIASAADYLGPTPNVSFTEDGQTGSRGIGISIRGVGTLVSGENAFINSIGIYLDEFSVVSVPNQVANPELPDMERVEILRGPQGTYFGRNAVGGALNLTTRRPTENFEGSIKLGFEDYDDAGDAYNFTGVLNVPASDDFRLRGVVYYEDSDGFVENICAAGSSAAQCPGAGENGFTPNGAEDSGHETVNLRLNSDWNPFDRTTVKTTLIYNDEDQGADENVPSGVLDLDSADTFGVGDAEDPGTGFWHDNQNRLSHDIDESTKNESLVGVLNISHEINDRMVFKSIAGFIDAGLDRLFDNDLVGGMDALVRTNSYEGESWSTELRLEITWEDHDLTLGLLYAEDEQTQENNVATSTDSTATINGVGVLPAFPEGLGLALNRKSFEVESLAVFADLTYRPNDRWELIAGARYTNDEVNNEIQAFGIRPTCCFPGSPGFPGDPGFDFFQSFENYRRPPARGDESFNDISPRLAVRYQATDNTGLYGTVSKGYKAGGSSVGNNTNADDAPFVVKFDDENLWNYELGVRTELLDGRLRLNVSVFYLEWENLQMEAFRFLTPGDLSSNFEQTINIEDAEASGVEVEFLAAVGDRLKLSGALGYLDTEITSDTRAEITGGFVVDLRDHELPKAPELTASLTGEYRWPIGGNEAWVRLEYIHRDGQYSDVEGLTNRQTRGPSPNSGIVRTLPRGEFPYRSPDYDLVNIRAGLDMERWRFNVYIENANDEEYWTGTQENFGLSGIRLRPHPTIYGGGISYSF